LVQTPNRKGSDNGPVTATDFSLRLRDGGLVKIRSIAPEDRELLRAAFERLSPESRYRRFFGPMPELSERELDYLTEVDHSDHEALVAIDEQAGGMVGVARFIRTTPAGAVAEPAITVADDWQGRGVGTSLLQALSRRAREEGITRFEAPVLATNAEAIRVLETLGETTKQRDGREVQLSIELPLPDAPSARWRALLRQFGRSALEPARTVLDRLWTRRSGSPHDQRANVIVVGSDGSESSRAAVLAAAELARTSGARVDVIGAHRFLSVDATELSVVVNQAADWLRAQGIDARAETRRGDAALVLTDIAFERNARLIVVGAGERAKATRRIVGSVADFVAERSPCNVLIVRPRQGDVEPAGKDPAPPSV
jgi:nucleotide-binding universal stress UspA family protein/RimJ/RimL family protein N-acetyltransferase